MEKPPLIAEAFLFVSPAGRAHCARPPRKRRPVCGDPGRAATSWRVYRSWNDHLLRPDRWSEIIWSRPTAGPMLSFHPNKLKRRVNARATRSGPVRQDKASKII
jgi:hypothetical protein